MGLDTSRLTLAIAVLWTSVFVIERIAELLQYQAAANPYPESLSEIQAPDEHEKALAYLGERNRLGWLRESVTLLVFLGVLATGAFGIITEIAERLTMTPWIRAILFVAFLSFLKGLLDLPFDWYSTFKIEAKYGFNRTTLGTFFGDRAKGAAVGLVVLSPILAFAMFLLETTGDRAWFLIWAGYSLFQFFLLFIAPIAILPLFLKLTPLPEGELKTAIDAYVAKQSFRMDGVFVCDASKRSTKTNAFFTGFGKFRRLVLFDTMLGKLKTDEIVAITAHEAGHFRLGHIWKGTVLSTVITAGVLFLAQRLLEAPELYLSFGIFPPQPAYGLPLAVLLLSKLGFFGSFATNYFSRSNEYAADRFSVETYGDREALIRGLKVLYRENLAILVQHPFFTALFASHPPFLPRTDAIRNRD